MNFADFRRLTHLEQSLFGLPFLLAGGLLPFACKEGVFEFPLKAAWAFPAFFAARISGMAFNQWLDRCYDAKNPRTQERLIPSGKVSVFSVAFLAWASLFIFLGCVAQINFLCLKLSLGAAFLIAVYSLCKRVHPCCHFVLGLIHGLCPVMAWVSITGEWSWTPCWLGLSSFFIISGNDILYAFQDIEIDRRDHLKSLPALKGKIWCQKCVRFLHVLSVISLVILGSLSDFPKFYYLCPGAIGVFLFWAHRRIDKQETLFFLANAVTSLLVFGMIGWIITWRVLL